MAFDLEKFKKIIKQECDLDGPIPNHWYVVLNLEEKLDDFYGHGPFSCAIAQCKYIEENGIEVRKWYNAEGDPLAYYDFRDVNAHNVFDHSAQVTHWIDGYDLSCIFFMMMDEGYYKRTYNEK